VEPSDYQLMQDGISVRLEGAGTSEMLMFENAEATARTAEKEPAKTGKTR